MKFPLIALSALLPFALVASVPVRPAPPQHLAFQEFADDIGSAGREEVRMVFRSRAEYELYFDHRTPVEVDWNTEWVVFYSAGLQPSAGFEAKVLDIQLTEAGHSFLITTQLLSPGPDCLVAAVITKPHTLVKFTNPNIVARYANPTRDLGVVRFQRLDVEISCAQ